MEEEGEEEGVGGGGGGGRNGGRGGVYRMTIGSVNLENGEQGCVGFFSKRFSTPILDES